MIHKREAVRRILDDDAALIAWIVDLARATPDVYVRIPAAGVSAATHLRDGLGIDSIGRMCVHYAFVDALGLEDDDETAVASWTTVGDVLAFVRARVP